MTAARPVIPGRTFLITRRCTQRQFLLRPDASVERTYLYCLGEAAERLGITLHGWIAMGNHQHLIVRDNKGNLPEFLAQFHKMVAKVLNVHHGRRENLWASEQASVVHLVTPRDAFDKLIYLLTNPVSGHLVDRVADWPGASSFRQHLGNRAITVKRPRLFFRADGAMPREVTLKLEKLDGYSDMADEEWSRKIADAVRVAEEQARRERMRAGRGVLGRKKVLSLSPTASPSTPEPRRDVCPHIACRNRELRIRALAALRAFRRTYREARLRFERGEKHVEFPTGTYWMLRFRAHFVFEAKLDSA